MNTANQVIIHWAEEGKWLSFRDPLEILVTADPREVAAILDHIEKEVETKGLYAAGFVAYEAAAVFDSALRFCPAGDFPLLWFGLFRAAAPFAVPTASAAATWSPAWENSVTKPEYLQAIQAIKSFIVQGATYQVNYSYRLRAPLTGNAREYFFQNAGAGDIPYAAFVESDRYAICSFSPELFFTLRDGVIASRPMKGTMPRGLLRADDLEAARRLYVSEKNRAENIMIVDMVRNDLSRIALPGTVQVTDQFAVEKYATVWQMTSTVTARTDASLFKIFQALFPPASVTGAPKVRTMQIIAELETSPRRIYTGSIGFLAPGRRAQFNVAIRTLLADKFGGAVEYGVGGGIVWDSVDTAEYEECAVKSKIVRRPAVDFSLLETLLWTPRKGFLLLDFHLARLKASAAYFSFQLDEESLKNRLSELAAGLPPGPQRVRLLLGRDGKITCAARPYDADWKKLRPLVGLAKDPVAADDVFLYHKTTNRLVYERARAARPDYDEVVLWNEKGEVTEFCAANIIVDLDGRLLTPPVSCGLLPGTYRAWLLQKGLIKEETIAIEKLRLCRRIYLCNSVRKMREVRLDV